MLVLGPIGFTAPWLLLGLLALPILWILLRAVPPAPVRRLFPGVALLLGLHDDAQQSDRTPWWLLLLRSLAIAALILGFAGPVLNPDQRVAGTGPLLVVMDGSWASARDWQRQIDRAGQALDEAGRDGRTVAVVNLADAPTEPPAFQAADAWSARLAGITPQAWTASTGDINAWANMLEGPFDTLWISDGLDQPWRADLLAALEDHGTLSVVESPRPLYGLGPARFEDGTVVVTGQRARPEGAAQVAVIARGLDPNGVERELARGMLGFADGAAQAELALSLPPELRNRVTRFEIEGTRSAGAVSLTDDALKRREVALLSGSANREGLQLLSPTHYLVQALDPVADLIDGSIEDILLANPDVIVLADVATLTDTAAAGIADWVEAGGLLLRFAGPRLAASDLSRSTADPLMPVRLRAGGRSVGGAMSWGEPKAMRPFPESSPFHGLAVPPDVAVTAQVMAQPDPDLADRVIASLTDGTPLVTRKRMGQGQVVLFHVTANAEWSNLPLSGLFVQMLERLAVSTRPARPDAADLAGTVWMVDSLLDGFGVVGDAGNLPGIPGEALAAATPGPQTPPGLYAGEDRRIALNVLSEETEISPTAWPERIAVEGLETQRETALKGALLLAALGALALDILASLWLGGRLIGPRAGRTGRRAGGAAICLALALGLGGVTDRALAQAGPEDDAAAIRATVGVALAHVVTGDAQVDDVALAGLEGLSRTLFGRTSVEPVAPVSVDLELDELAFYPFLYWPVVPGQPIPSDAAYAKLNTYLRTGGMILFDTRDADIAGFGASSPNGRKLQQLAAPLDIPPLEPVPEDHVLTRTFYLLSDFPGRHAGRDLWVEAAPPDAERAEGMPFRNLNDNVTPVVIGGNDWAAAWAIDDAGNRMFPVGRGYAGERQREIAYRFGVNLIMHVLTGNYKSDQVHVPALLDRLGQ